MSHQSLFGNDWNLKPSLLVFNKVQTELSPSLNFDILIFQIYSFCKVHQEPDEEAVSLKTPAGATPKLSPNSRTFKPEEKHMDKPGYVDAHGTQQGAGVQHADKTPKRHS